MGRLFVLGGSSASFAGIAWASALVLAMIGYILWFALLIGIIKTMRGLPRAIFVCLYVFGSLVVML